MDIPLNARKAVMDGVTRYLQLDKRRGQSDRQVPEPS